MGVYMGIFNFFIVLPEILAALTFGPLVKHVLGGNLVHAVMAGGVFMLVAAALTFTVPATTTSPEQLQAALREDEIVPTATPPETLS
jgi:maltose/moltooligosaccharide transporter